MCFSVHAGGSESQELRDLQEMLRSQDITPAERQSVEIIIISFLKCTTPAHTKSCKLSAFYKENSVKTGIDI